MKVVIVSASVKKIKVFTKVLFTITPNFNPMITNFSKKTISYSKIR